MGSKAGLKAARAARVGHDFGLGATQQHGVDRYEFKGLPIDTASSGWV